MGTWFRKLSRKPTRVPRGGIVWTAKAIYTIFLREVDLVISDGHNDIQTAVKTMYPGSLWQMCHVHSIRAILRKVPHKYYKEIAKTLKECLNDSRRLEEFAVHPDNRGLSRAADTIRR